MLPPPHLTPTYIVEVTDEADSHPDSGTQYRIHLLPSRGMGWTPSPDVAATPRMAGQLPR